MRNPVISEYARGPGIRSVPAVSVRKGLADYCSRCGPEEGNPKQPREPKTPRVVELLRKATEWQALLESGEFTSQGDIAIREGITRARVTQVMGMLRLGPEIQRQVLSIAEAVRRPAVTERVLRPIETISNFRDQLEEFYKLLIKEHHDEVRS